MRVAAHAAAANAAVANAAASDQPMREMNTTPLIDVMLVLLIMFIITIPVQTHIVPIDLPAPSDIVVHRERNKVAIGESGNLLWNGAPITLGALRSTLQRLSAMQPQPELHFEPHPEARYHVVDEVLAAMKRAKVTASGMVGNERYANF